MPTDALLAGAFLLTGFSFPLAGFFALTAFALAGFFSLTSFTVTFSFSFFELAGFAFADAGLAFAVAVAGLAAALALGEETGLVPVASVLGLTRLAEAVFLTAVGLLADAEDFVGLALGVAALLPTAVFFGAAV